MIANVLTASDEARPVEDWIEAPLLSEQDLAGSSWRFGDLEGQSFSPFLVLAPEGSVGNFFHEQIDHWQVFNGRLFFINKLGLPSIIFNVAQVRGDQIVSLAGRAIGGAVETVYVLNVTSHPEMRSPADTWQEQRRATFLREPGAAARRPNLVVVRANAASLHPQWFDGLDNRTRSWDLCVSWYGDEAPDASIPADYLVHAPKQPKFKPIFDLFYKGSPLWNYDRIWLPDDDLRCAGSDINLMFHLSRRYGLDLSQPSLRKSADCHINHPITAQQEGRDVRFAPFVEIMCPLFSKRSLEICIGSLKEAKSGYGLDHLWPSFLGRPATRIGIIDAVSIVHTRPIGASYDVSGAIAEQGALWKAYGFSYKPIDGVR